MSESQQRHRQRWNNCKQHRETRDRYINKRTVHQHQRVALIEEINKLHGKISYFENELTRIEQIIRKVSGSAAQCVIGGIAKRGPTECLPLLVDLRNSEADYQAQLGQIKQMLRQVEYRFQGIEDEIAYDDQVIDNAVRDIRNDQCSELGIS